MTAKYMEISEAAEQLDVHVATIRRAIKAGKLKSDPIRQWVPSGHRGVGRVRSELSGRS